jgi:hypothetical protein
MSTGIFNDPNDSDYEIEQIYNDPNADTVIIYDTDGEQHLEVKEK